MEEVRNECCLLKYSRKNGRKADFETQEIIGIKAALGPWPRALEAAGLKEPRENKNQPKRNS